MEIYGSVSEAGELGLNVLVKFLLYQNWISSMAALLCIGASKKTTKKLSENAPVYLKATWS